MLYNVCHDPGKCTQILKIDDSNYIHAIPNRCYSSISSNKDLEPSQAVSSRVCSYEGWATVRNPHSSRMVSQRRLTTLELAGETQHKILLEIITLYGRYWPLLGINRKLIDLLCRNNIVGGSSWAKPQKKRSPSNLAFYCIYVIDWKGYSWYSEIRFKISVWRTHTCNSAKFEKPLQQGKSNYKSSSSLSFSS